MEDLYNSIHQLVLRESTGKVNLGMNLIKQIVALVDSYDKNSNYINVKVYRHNANGDKYELLYTKSVHINKIYSINDKIEKGEIKIVDLFYRFDFNFKGFEYSINTANISLFD